MVTDIFQPDDLVFEIGACTGGMVAVLLELGAGKVIAVEPDRVNVATLYYYFGDHERVAIVHAGAGEQVGTGTLASNIGAVSCSTFVPEATWGPDELYAGMQATEYQVVPMTTLDALIAEHGIPAFCHVTANRYELWVLRGLSQPLPYLAFEVTHCSIRQGWASQCIDRCVEVMPNARFNYTDRDVWRKNERGELYQNPLRWPEWVGADEVRGILAEIDEVGLWGRIHVRG